MAIWCIMTVFIASMLFWVACLAQTSGELPSFDFTAPETVAEWRPTHHVSGLSHTAEGMMIEIAGHDPYIHGPVRDFPEGLALWLEIRLKSEQTGMLQVFYARAGQGTAEERSARRAVATTDWVTVRMPLPALGPRTWLRIDPPGNSGKCTIAYVRFAPRVTPSAPRWQPPTPSTMPEHAPSVSSGELRITFHPQQVGTYVVSVNGRPMALNWNTPQLCYEIDGNTRWLSIDPTASASLSQERNRVRLVYAFTDPDGANWRVEQVFSPSPQTGAVDVRTAVTTDRERQVYFLPLLVLFPGVGSFGSKKGQALFAGLEYLENEPSSSEADIIGPASRRQVPDNLKITAPLMVIQAEGRYAGIIWQPANHFSALFDSPDRIFRSGGHVMGILFPGSNGDNREEGSLLPYAPQVLLANTPLVLDATIIGGQGETVVLAVQQYVRLRGLPPVPNTGLDAQAYLRLAAAGWLDSKIREGNLYRHAIWPGFNPQPAADAAVWMEWIAAHIGDAQTAQRLREAAQQAIAAVSRDQYLFSRVSHVAFPVAPLVFGAVPESLQAARNAARDLLRSFEPDGTVVFKPAPNKPDYARTHWERTANGLTASVLVRLLEMALYTGDKELTQQAIRRLEQFRRFDNTVPRGAQTWEMPLHTPDILASAHIVKAYVMGYELTGNPEFLRRARYWAWTGVPFPYLINPTGQPVGPYSTIAVLGATNWHAPVWFGLPVQWCGLVYADALYWLARLEPKAHWKQIADGITAAGIQHTWKQDDPERQGCLPDFYHLREQRTDGPPINPGTVQANAVRLYNLTPVYDYRVLRNSGVILHAPGAIEVREDRQNRCRFRLKSWMNRPYFVLINGLSQRPQVRVNGQPLTVAQPHQYLSDGGNLILQLQGDVSIELTL